MSNVPFNGFEEIVRVRRSGELAVEVVGSMRRSIEPEHGEGVLFVGVGGGVGFNHHFFSHGHC